MKKKIIQLICCFIPFKKNRNMIRQYFFGKKVEQDLVDDYKTFFENVYRGKDAHIFIEDKELLIEGESDNTLWTSKGVLVDHEYDFLSKEKFVLIDIGFNLGISSLHLSRYENITKIYGFEPFVPTYNLAQINLEHNLKLSQKIELHNYGLGNKDDILTISYHHKFPGSMSTVQDLFGGHGLKEEKIVVKKASEILNPIISNHSEKIYLKIDCEGAEFQIIPDLANSGILKKVHLIVMEWHFKSPDEIINILMNNGFVCFNRVDEENKLGLIKAVKIQ